MAKTVIVVDMQKGFMHSSGTLFCGEGARAIIPLVVRRIEQEMVAGATIFFTQDSHEPEDREFQMFPPHCLEGSEDHEFIVELTELAAAARVIKKRRYALFTTPTWLNSCRRSIQSRS